MRQKIIAVVVTYFPDIETLLRQLNALAPQVSSIIIVDNGSSEDCFPGSHSEIKSMALVVPLDDNYGIAKAQNYGIARARQKNAEYVLLLDQDSIPATDMVENLVQATTHLSNFASVGPRYVDKRGKGSSSFVQLKGLKLRRCDCENDEVIIPVQHLIASGCLIPLSVLDKVGGMKESLFIDYVDIEWGLRALHFGYQSYGVCNAMMEHNIGEQQKTFFGMSIPMHNPLRQYYLFRNAILLNRTPGIPLNWKIAHGWGLLLKFGYYALFVRPYLKNWRMMILGLWHGMHNRAGKYGGDGEKYLQGNAFR